MTNSEFSNEFDVFYNNITSNQAPGLDEYEKSVFLTRAQDDILKSYFDPRSNKVQEGFDGSERRQIDFSMVTKVGETNVFNNPIFDYRDNSKSILLASDILIPINEQVIVTRNNKSEYLQVLPITYDEYRRLMSKPYKRPLKFQAWRLINGVDNSNSADIIVGPGDTITKYTMRYVKRPKPIILDNVDLTINGVSGPSECELDPILHHELLQRGIELAKAAYIGDLNSQIALGTNSQTSIGMLTQSK